MTRQIIGQNYLSQSVLKRVLYGQITLGGDAHHEEGLEGHEDVLGRVPQVGEEHNEQLVVQVEIEPLQDSWLVPGSRFSLSGLSSRE